MSGPLAGLRILDLTRILAGPSCTQLLGDLGADVIKIERPGSGDDTRGWGPPYLRDAAGKETAESAYFLSANRNKRSVTLDFTRPEGQALLHRLLGHCDILVENFKVGGLAKYELAYEQLKARHPRLVYGSLTGFGQTGPYASRAGYDFMIQGMGGIMSITGEPDGQPTKVGVAIADLMAGMYLAVALLAAIRHRDLTGRGQQVDLSLLDTQVAWLGNQAMNYLVGRTVPGRLGNAHPNIVPYQVFATADGHIILAVGNDAQFERFCGFIGRPELARDPRFATNTARVKHREALLARLEPALASQPSAYWLDGLERLVVPCGPINTIDQVLADPQIRHRGMVVEMAHPLTADSDPLRLLGNPIHLSESQAAYTRPPPLLGEHTREVLEELLGLDAAELDALRRRRVV